ncbi:MAG TPA: alpha-amylase family glycosyl hydrolase [Thermomicrobiales bacterium]|nr:alpha-amylase family glycosyl hydrolase [Thermomicrobiales bacterium]
MSSWSHDAIFYHIYPLGLLDAPLENAIEAPAVSRLPGLASWAPHIRDLGVNALYLGPLFESGTHGYDTIDYRRVDRRLGTNEDLRALVETFHQHGIRVVLDGVLNHVSREFPQFRDLRERGEFSRYRDWFVNVTFGQKSPFGDPFIYDGWSGHLNLVKLNLANPEVREYLFGVVRQWFAEFGIDGLRLDAADVMDKAFLRDLAAVCREANPDCWLIGEIVVGNYAEWAGPGMLDSVTNYEAFKGLYSSLNDRNLFEIAWSLNREFGPEGVYRGLPLYNFADNHDVDRVASLLKNGDDLFPLYAMLFTMPGVPSIYYGSEWGYSGKKQGGDDGPLRPAFAWPVARETMERPELMPWIARLAAIRHETPAIQVGDYLQLHVAAEQFAFLRHMQHESQSAVVVINAASIPATLSLPVPAIPDGTVLTDAIDISYTVCVKDGAIDLGAVPAATTRILRTAIL